MKKGSNYKVHFLVSIFVFLLTIFILDFLKIKSNYIFLISICIVYGLLPDIDTSKSIIWKIISSILIIIAIILWSYMFAIFILLALFITIIMKHRGFTHTYLSALILSLPLLYLDLGLFIGGIVSYTFHLIIDGHIKFM
jgi:membrane-bound metal-dependent hydrolase YbcI (DUF457 family)